MATQQIIDCSTGAQTESAFTPLAPPRAEIPKSTAMARVATEGKIDAVFTLLQSQPLLFAQWFSPDWPNVFCDDAGFLAALDAVGCTAEQKARISAPLG